MSELNMLLSLFLIQHGVTTIYIRCLYYARRFKGPKRWFIVPWKMDTGHMQTLHTLIQGTWASLDFDIWKRPLLDTWFGYRYLLCLGFVEVKRKQKQEEEAKKIQGVTLLGVYTHINNVYRLNLCLFLTPYGLVWESFSLDYATLPADYF